MTLKKYYYQFNKNDLYPVQFNCRGIPIVYLPDVGRVCHPVTVANWGLHLYNTYIEFNDSASLNRASNLADWLVKNQQDGVWYINFPNSYYKIDAPWPSAMVQGQAIALLSRIALVTRKREYLDIAILALQPFGRSSDKGGVLIHTESGDFYEEFPSSPPSMVLNGFIFSLIGLYDLWVNHRVGEAERLFEAGFKTLIKIIDRYDTGFWTRYDLYPVQRLSSQEYHSLHISLLESLLKIAFEQKIVDIIKKWRCYRNNIFCQTSWLIFKLKEKMKDSSYTSTLKLRIR